MKIVVTGTRDIPNVMGGVETHCEELFPRIAKMGFDVTIVRRENYVHDDLTEWNGVKLIDIESPKKKSFEAVIHTFKAVNRAKQLGADVLHIHAIGPALLVPYAKMLGLKVVFTHHGPDYDRDKWGIVAKTILDHTDYPEYFEKLGITEGNYILGMCRFVPEKNLHHLVDAFRRVNKKGCRLVLAGDTDFEDAYLCSLKRQAKESGVILTRFVKGRKLHSLLTKARCYVLPSSHEVLPIALLEAMSYQLPVIVSF